MFLVYYLGLALQNLSEQHLEFHKIEFAALAITLRSLLQFLPQFEEHATDEVVIIDVLAIALDLLLIFGEAWDRQRLGIE